MNLNLTSIKNELGTTSATAYLHNVGTIFAQSLDVSRVIQGCRKNISRDFLEFLRGLELCFDSI